MRCRQIQASPGDIVPVRDSYHYPLPTGLPSGSKVKLITYEAGYWIVEHNSAHFTVFATLLDTGFEYEHKGRWYPPDHPLIASARAQTQ